MEDKFYLILEKRLFCEHNKKAYEFINGKWVEADWREIHDRLMGYDPTESDPMYGIGNTDIMAEIKKTTKEEVIEKYGEETINKLNNIYN